MFADLEHINSYAQNACIDNVHVGYVFKGSKGYAIRYKDKHVSETFYPTEEKAVMALKDKYVMEY